MEDETNTDPLVAHREKSKADADKADQQAKNQRKFNESRRQARAFNRALAKEKNNALQNARSTTERRAIKAKYKEALKPLKPRSAYGDLVGYDEEFTEETSFGEEDTADTFELDVVKDDNTAGTATFNGSGIDD